MFEKNMKVSLLLDFYGIPFYNISGKALILALFEKARFDVARLCW